MNWGLISQIATAVGAIISTVGIISLYLLYRMGKRDEYVKRIRQTLSKCRYNCERLNLMAMIRYEVFSEIANCIVYSENLTSRLHRIFNTYFATNNISKEDFAKKLETDFGPITVSIHTALLNEIDRMVNENKLNAEIIRKDYPCLYRILISVNIFFENIIVGYIEKIVRNEELWKTNLLHFFEKRSEFRDVRSLQEKIFDLFLYLAIKESEWEQRRTTILLEILNLTVNAYLELSDNKLYKTKDREKKLALRKTEQISDDLREAEKGLKRVLSQNQIREYRKLVVEFEEQCRKHKNRKELLASLIAQSR